MRARMEQFSNRCIRFHGTDACTGQRVRTRGFPCGARPLAWNNSPIVASDSMGQTPAPGSEFACGASLAAHGLLHGTILQSLRPIPWDRRLHRAASLHAGLPFRRTASLSCCTQGVRTSLTRRKGSPACKLLSEIRHCSLCVLVPARRVGDLGLTRETQVPGFPRRKTRPVPGDAAASRRSSSGPPGPGRNSEGGHRISTRSPWQRPVPRPADRPG